MTPNNYAILRSIAENDTLTTEQKNTLDWAINWLEILERQEGEANGLRSFNEALSSHCDQLAHKLKSCTNAIRALTEALDDDTYRTIYSGR